MDETRYTLPAEDNEALGVRLYEAVLDPQVERIVLTFLRDDTELSKAEYTKPMLWLWHRDVPPGATHVMVETLVDRVG